jgi:hypothetical protein
MQPVDDPQPAVRALGDRVPDHAVDEDQRTPAGEQFRQGGEERSRIDRCDFSPTAEAHHVRMVDRAEPGRAARSSPVTVGHAHFTGVRPARR